LRVLIISDAWFPQVNGVVRTLSTLVGELRTMGHQAEVIGPDRFRSVPCPTYPEIRLALFPRRRLAKLIESYMPAAVHIATEGPLGFAARAWCRRNGLPFTTAYHTKFPEYVSARTRIPARVLHAWMRRFHRASSGVMVATQSLNDDLFARGYRNLRHWTRGVDLTLFEPHIDPAVPRQDWGLPRPIFIYVGRVAVEKNIRAFLDLDLPGSKVVVGDGPQREALQRDYPNVHFTGAKFGRDLAAAYAGGDVFVFPSRTDTFGLVILESLACGTPVAAYPVTGPKDVVVPAVGALNEDLRAAALEALTKDRTACRAHAEKFSWRACTEMFLANLAPFDRWAEQPAPAPASG
jgi:glycosyltransferase involved in cell wall biosynthesis